MKKRVSSKLFNYSKTTKIYTKIDKRISMEMLQALGVVDITITSSLLKNKTQIKS